MQARDLEGLPRKELIERASRLGVQNAGVLTRAELCDEILRMSVKDPVERRAARGLLGVARDLVASVIERGLHLPDAAARIRGGRRAAPAPRPPLATVTLAEIYASQGHKARAKAVLDEVISADPEHDAARTLRDSIGDAEPPAAAEARSALPEEPLFERYGVDALAMVPVDAATTYVRWELRDDTLQRVRAGGEGKPVLRIAAVTATWDGPMVDYREIDLGGPVGDRFIRDLPDGALVRAAAGWCGVLGFDPLAVAVDVAPVAEPGGVGDGSIPPPAREGIPDAAVREGLEQARCRASLEPDGEEKTMISWQAASAVRWQVPAAGEGAA
jgi:hypothetical protein